MSSFLGMVAAGVLAMMTASDLDGSKFYSEAVRLAQLRAFGTKANCRSALTD